MSAVKALEVVKASAEAIKSDELQRFPEAAAVGDYFRQGDIYITKLGVVVGKKSKVVLQLAPGTTKGSRHVLDSPDGVSMYLIPNADALTGPVIETTCERTITHPEHGDVLLTPGVYGITYQRAYAEELRRVQD